jgi:caffeoyl-CoA O-methyltransferase
MIVSVNSQKTARPVTPLTILVQQLEKILKLAEEMESPALLKTSLKEAYHLAAGIDRYTEEVSTQQSSALANLAQKTQQEDWSTRFSDGETVRQLEQEMLSGHLEGQVLKMFVYMMKAKRILEIGMFTGYSALAMAEALPEDGCLVACEVDEYVADFARNCFDSSPHGHKIEVKVAPALETMEKLADAGASFDLVFIDADKKEYLNYFQMLLETGLLQDGGFICIDNTLFQGQVYLPEQRTTNGNAIAEFNRIVADDPRVEQVILPLRDGLTIIRHQGNQS